MANTLLMNAFRGQGMQQPGKCDRCNTSACGPASGNKVLFIERPDDPWGHMQIGGRCIKQVAYKLGLKPIEHHDSAVKTASDLLTENDSLRKQLADLTARHDALRAELAAEYASA